MVPDIGNLHLTSKKGKISCTVCSLQATYVLFYNSNAVTTTGIVFVKRRVGHLPYEDDKDVIIHSYTMHIVYYICMC